MKPWLWFTIGGFLLDSGLGEDIVRFPQWDRLSTNVSVYLSIPICISSFYKSMWSLSSPYTCMYVYLIYLPIYIIYTGTSVWLSLGPKVSALQRLLVWVLFLGLMAPWFLMSEDIRHTHEDRVSRVSFPLCLPGCIEGRGEQLFSTAPFHWDFAVLLQPWKQWILPVMDWTLCHGGQNESLSL